MDMGYVVGGNEEKVVDYESDGVVYWVCGREISMGNPYFVIMVGRNLVIFEEAMRVGLRLERYFVFLDGVNIEFVECVVINFLCVFVWERGCGFI